jgi:hypothetical protein
MRRSLLLSIFVWNIIVLSLCCSSTDEGVNQNTKESQHVNSKVTKGNDTVENDTNKKLENLDKIKKLENYFRGEVKQIPRKLGLVQLTKTSLRNDFELRLWINLGMASDEKLLIVRSSSSGNNASLYHLQKTTSDPLIFNKEVLASPKSDWKSFLSEISNRLATPNRLLLDPNFDISRHEGVIFLEVLEKGEYQFVFYRQHTSFGDGIRLINLCEYLSGEFGVNIDCRGERTALGPIR